MSFELPKLEYNYNALEPNIDAKTMEIHHSKHHQGYTNNLNNAIAGTELEGKSIEEICKSDNLSAAVRNNGGGYFNHSLFWTILSQNGGGEPNNEVGKAINEKYGSFENFKSEFTKAAGTRFGSGWAWLCLSNGNLSICSTANQDNPLMQEGCGGQPILCLDVWEHAYYLNYQNRRPDYINAFFNVINWEKVNNLYLEAL
jgi:Fe-Mn family superoxide dismutase|tara:strand:- start:9396 stop:9995 length:600 start_codon:yes stop_codon:yes gene_type:complete